jgi:hypothetical protein
MLNVQWENGNDMKANELRIGNYVYLGTEVYQIKTGSEIGYGENVFKPILLTEEWLLKFGFKRDGRSLKLKNFGRFMFLEIGISFYPAGNLNCLLKRDIIQRVHQLQNLYFALTGEELTIKQT